MIHASRGMTVLINGCNKTNNIASEDCYPTKFPVYDVA